MNVEDPLVRRYLDQLRDALEETSIGVEEQGEILREIESHIVEARGAGASVAQILEKLGRAHELARGYEMELMLRPRAQWPAIRWAVQVLMALATLLLAIVVGVTGLGLLAGGLVAVVAGIVGPFLPPTLLDPTLRPGLPQLVVLLTGLTLGGVGFLLLRILRLNLRLLIAAIRRALPL